MNIQEFIDYKSSCIFCNGPLMPFLTHMIVISDRIGLSRILLGDGKFIFPVKIFSPILEISYLNDVSVEGLNIIIDITANTFTPSRRVLAYDWVRLQTAFLSIAPVFECCCHECNYHYLSTILKFGVVHSTKIEPLDVSYESFIVNNFVVHNHEDCTIIYSTRDEHTEPLKFPLIDFSGMNKERRLARVQMLVTFN